MVELELRLSPTAPPSLFCAAIEYTIILQYTLGPEPVLLVWTTNTYTPGTFKVYTGSCGDSLLDFTTKPIDRDNTTKMSTNCAKDVAVFHLSYFYPGIHAGPDNE